MFFKHEICATIEKPDRTLEPFILKQPKQAYIYAKRVLKKRWKKAEKVILHGYSDHTLPGWNKSHTRAEYIYLYAKNVLKRRWKEGEKVLLETLKNHGVGYYWASEAADNLALYAKHVVKGRWKEAESFIAKSNNIDVYLSVLDEEGLIEFKNMITVEAISGSGTAKRFFSWKPTHTVKVKGSKEYGVMLDLDGNYNRCHTAYGSSAVAAKHYSAFTLSEWISNSSAKLEYNPENKNWYWGPQVKHHFYDPADAIFQGTVTPIG